MNQQQSQPEEQAQNTGNLLAVSEDNFQSEQSMSSTALPTGINLELDEMGANLRKMVRSHFRSIAGFFGTVLIFYLTLISVLSLTENAQLNEQGTIILSSNVFKLWTVICIVIGVAFFIITFLNVSRKRNKLIDALSSVEDRAAITHLLKALKLADIKVSRAALGGLIRILPRLQPDDAHMFNAGQRDQLCHLLSKPPTYRLQSSTQQSEHVPMSTLQLRIAILHALSRVGDHNALPVVRRLAQTQPYSNSQKRIQEAALHCLPLLLARVEQQQSSQTLLRAADPINSGTETLLRPASGTDGIPPEQLLRPSNSL